MELSSFFKIYGLKLDYAVVLNGVCDVDSLIDGKAVDLAVLMVDMGSQR